MNNTIRLARSINELENALAGVSNATDAQDEFFAYDRLETAARAVIDAYDAAIDRPLPVMGEDNQESLDTSSSASRQHYIDTGEYLREGEAL